MRDKIKNSINSLAKIKFSVVYIALALFMLMFMFYQGGKQSFWLDEMSLLGTITKDKSVGDILGQYLTIDVTNLPIFPLAAAFWYRVLPANDRIMLLLPELAVFGTVIWCGMTGELVAGKKSGLIAAILASVSTKLILSCGFELRSYGFLLLFGTGTIYYFLKRIEYDDLKVEIKFGVFLALTLYTHYMGGILIAALGAAEVVMFLVDKTRIKKFIPYIIAGASFVPWFVLMLICKQKSITSFWPDKPTLPEITRVMRKLLSSNEALFIVLILTFLYVLCRAVRTWLEGNTLSFKHKSLLILSWIVLFMLGSVFVYSAIINPAGGFFVLRYFLELIPVMLVIIAVGIADTIDFVSSGRNSTLRLEITAVVAMFLILYVGLINLRTVRDSSSKSSETFREAAVWVKAQDGLYDKDAAVVCSVNPRATAGFVEYYVREGAKKAPVPMISLQDTDPVSDLKKYDKLYLVYVHRDMEKLADDVKEYLADNFEIKENYEDIKAALYVRK
ncbi:MAG: glycosyltransferase family 39 protein [Lachnospiraceae bacterium]|nr:glycosyltransferase family 39 protein [Lachnospiraceae bacterium]